MPADYQSTARGLSLPAQDSDEESDMNHSSAWRRLPINSTSHEADNRESLRQRVSGFKRGAINGLASATTMMRQAAEMYLSLSPLQKILIASTGIVGLVALILLLTYRETVFAWIAPIAAGWRDIPFGWLILWIATVIVSFPPMIGYSNCVLLSGFVFGIWRGWLIVASATVIGSLASFIVSRTVLSSFVHRIVAHDRRFTALALTLKHDGIKLLIMIRLCPLPYSIANGAMSTFPTVTALNFFIASVAATPKLLIHTFIGSRLAALADNIDGMDRGTKILNYLSIALGVTFGLLTAWFVYRQTKRRAAELEAQEEDAGENFNDDVEDDMNPDEFHHDQRLHKNLKSTTAPRQSDQYSDEPSWEDGAFRPITLRVTRPSSDGYYDNTVKAKSSYGTDKHASSAEDDYNMKK